MIAIDAVLAVKGKSPVVAFMKRVRAAVAASAGAETFDDLPRNARVNNPRDELGTTLTSCWRRGADVPPLLARAFAPLPAKASFAFARFIDACSMALHKRDLRENRPRFAQPLRRVFKDVADFGKWLRNILKRPPGGPFSYPPSGSLRLFR